MRLGTGLVLPNAVRGAASGGGIAPSISGVPTISGTPEQGQTLTANLAPSSGSPAPTNTVRWLRNGVAIAGATGLTYVVAVADLGTTLTVEQTATNGVGSPAVATSAGTKVLWTPAALGSDLALWMDARDAATITLNGSTVSQWNDKSSNGRNVAQATAANQPTRALNNINGRTALTFDGGDYLFTTANVASLLRNLAGASFGAVWRGTNVSQQRALFTIHFGAGNGRLFPVLQQAGTVNMPARRVTAEPSGTLIASPPAYVNGTTIVHTGTINYGTGAMAQFVNGSAAGTATLPSTGNSDGFDTTTLVVGAAANNGISPAFQHLGEIGEIVVVHKTLSTAEREILDGYLAWGWGQEATLPAGHPYRNAAP